MTTLESLAALDSDDLKLQVPRRKWIWTGLSYLF